jgi:endonuclease/exonuclease/phosphatase (EEP) superfamily protein YafD
LSWGYLAVAAIACVTLWTLADRWWPATLFLFGPRWVLLLPLAALIPLALKRRVSLLIPLAIGAAIVLFPIMGLRLGWLSRLGSDEGTATLRVVTLNTDGALGPALDLPFRLKEWRADIVALQECGEVLQAAVVGLEGWHRHATGQMCVLSRYPIRSAAITSWDDLEAARERGIGGSSQAVSYVIDTPHRSVQFVNLHLETPRKGLEGLFELDIGRVAENTTLRSIESSRTRSWLGAATGSVIIAGDFNMPVESAIYRRDWAEFRNAFSGAGVGFGMTRDNGWIQVRIDHILTGSHWQTKRVSVIRGAGHDHRPVVAELAWTGPRAAATSDADSLSGLR